MRYNIIVKPHASSTRLISKDEATQTLTIALHALPIEGRANQELIRFLANEFSVAKSRITIIRGLHARKKVVEIT